MGHDLEKLFVSAEELLRDSFELGLRIFENGYRPTFIVGVWRGGTPIAIAIQEVLDLLGCKTDHYAIRTASYYGMGKQSKEVKLFGLQHLAETLKLKIICLSLMMFLIAGALLRPFSKHWTRPASTIGPKIFVSPPSIINLSETRQNASPIFTYTRQINGPSSRMSWTGYRWKKYVRTNLCRSVFTTYCLKTSANNYPLEEWQTACNLLPSGSRT